MKNTGASKTELDALFQEIYREQLKAEGKSDRQCDALVRLRELGLRVVEGSRP